MLSLVEIYIYLSINIFVITCIKFRFKFLPFILLGLEAVGMLRGGHHQRHQAVFKAKFCYFKGTICVILSDPPYKEGNNVTIMTTHICKNRYVTFSVISVSNNKIPLILQSTGMEWTSINQCNSLNQHKIIQNYFYKFF